jgi:hypothetical protein
MELTNHGYCCNGVAITNLAKTACDVKYRIINNLSGCGSKKKCLFFQNFSDNKKSQIHL